MTKEGDVVEGATGSSGAEGIHTGRLLNTLLSHVLARFGLADDALIGQYPAAAADDCRAGAVSQA